MALCGAYTINWLGLELPAAYVRVNMIEITTTPGQPPVAVITYAVYVNEAARRCEKQPVLVDRCHAAGELFEKYFSLKVLDTSNPFRQAYLFLKTQDTFVGFSDV